jgi:DNA replication protein DnaC
MTVSVEKGVRRCGRVAIKEQRRMRDLIQLKPATWTVLITTLARVAKKLAAAEKNWPGPKRQRLLREAKRYKSLLDTKT